MGRDVPVKLAGAALLALSLAACGSWRGPKPLQAWKAVGKSPDVVALDEAAHALVAVQTREVERSADGRMAVRLELANLSDKDLNVQVRTLFRDKKGTPLGDTTPFEMVTLPGLGSSIYEASSFSESAAAFTVSVKTP